MAYSLNPFSAPEGLKDWPPYELAKRSDVQATLVAYIQAAGYNLVSTPLLEYDRVIGPVLPPSIAANAVRLIDDDAVMLLRPDHTVPIARLAGTHLAHETGPLMLAYSGPIYYRDDAGHCVERMQLGIEYIGDTDIARADVMILTLLSQCLAHLKLAYCIDVGHPDLGKTHTQMGLPERGRCLSRAPVALQSVLDQLDDPRITGNTSIHDDSRYYTGIMFEAAIASYGGYIARGGRYDTLLQQCGPARPAIGFCITLDALV